MKKLTFEPSFDAPVEKVWTYFSDIENYSKYLKYTKKVYSFGGFKEGALWDEWTTILFVPLYVRHQIKKIVPNEEIVYHVDLPGAKIWQKVSFKDLKEKTRLEIDITISFKNIFVEQILGEIVYKRNQNMVESSISNFIQRLKDDIN